MAHIKLGWQSDLDLPMRHLDRFKLVKFLPVRFWVIFSLTSVSLYYTAIRGFLFSAWYILGHLFIESFITPFLSAPNLHLSNPGLADQASDLDVHVLKSCLEGLLSWLVMCCSHTIIKSRHGASNLIPSDSLSVDMTYLGCRRHQSTQRVPTSLLHALTQLFVIKIDVLDRKSSINLVFYLFAMRNWF